MTPWCLSLSATGAPSVRRSHRLVLVTLRRGEPTWLGRCTTPAVDEVRNCKHGMSPKHARARMAHDHPHGLALARTVAMDVAVDTGRLLGTVGATGQAPAGIVLQAGAVTAQKRVTARGRTVMCSAVDAQHGHDGVQLTHQPGRGEPCRAPCRTSGFGGVRRRVHLIMLRSARGQRSALGQTGVGSARFVCPMRLDRPQ